MFWFYLQRLWSKIYIRLFVYLLVFAGFFSIFYSQRISIYNFFDYSFGGQNFENPSTYASSPFVENQKKSQRLTQSGMIKISRYAMSLYKYQKPKLILKSNFSFDNNWQQQLEDQALTITNILLNDMRLLCEPAFSEANVRANWQTEKKLQKLHSQKQGKKNSIAKAVTFENYESIKNALLRFDRSYFKTALQKKPDNVVAITIRQSIFSALCLPAQASSFWQQGIDYIEYKTENTLEKQNPSFQESPDELYYAVQEHLKKDDRYHFFLKELFALGSHYGGDNNWKLQESWNAFAFTNDKYYFRSFLQTTLKQIKGLSKLQNCQVFDHLYSVGYAGIEKEFLYTYTLAESAYRCGKIKQAKSIVRHILKQKFYQEHYQMRKAQRLAFLLELESY